MEVNNKYQVHVNSKNEVIAKAPSFKGFSPLGVVGNSMQWIEDKGFLASFLIQDVLGMTVPRVGAAFLRDKEYTGQYNYQEGFEVLGREGLTGPCMMAIAPLMFLLAARFGKTTSVNTQFIKRFGNSLTELLQSKSFSKDLLKNADAFKNEFFSKNIKEILRDTLGEKHATKDNIEYIITQLKTYQNSGKGSRKEIKRIKKSSIDNIVEFINDIKYSSSSELNTLGKVKLGSAEKGKNFAIKETFEAMMKYADDAIVYNKNLAQLDDIASESIKNKALSKRIITNVSTMAATLGILSVLPKIYACSDVAPGAKQNVMTDKNAENISFKGKGKQTKGFLEYLGKKINDNWGKKASEHFEYNGHNFTNTLMACLSLGGLLAPRGFRAYERAQRDENGKKDLTEVYEILIRDVISSLSVVFAVPMLTRAFVTSYEKNTGFVLMDKNRNMSKMKTLKDLLNPYSRTHVYSNAELKTIYGNINTQEKMLNFCEFISKNNGDLHKILSKSSDAVTLLKEQGLDLAELAKLDRKAKNASITEFFQKLGSKGRIKQSADDIVANIMKGTAGKFKGNKFISTARNLNSLPGAIATFFITPYLLGWIIPRLTYANTRRIHEKSDKTQNEKINMAV